MWSWARFYFYAYVRFFIHCLYFICERKIYVPTHVKTKNPKANKIFSQEALYCTLLKLADQE